MCATVNGFIAYVLSTYSADWIENVCRWDLQLSKYIDDDSLSEAEEGKLNFFIVCWRYEILSIGKNQHNFYRPHVSRDFPTFCWLLINV